MIAHGFWRHAAVIACAALVLCLTALWNGQPFLYPDTPTYLRGAETVVARIVGPKVFKPWLSTAPSASAVAAPAAGGGDPGPAAAAASPPNKSLTSIEDKIVLAGRSVFYGFLVYLGHLAGGMWLTIAAQGLAMAYVLHLLMARLWGLPAGQVLAVVTGLSLLTPLGVYTGLLMPDVFASLTILIVGLLAVYGPRLTAASWWILCALLLYGLTAHASHVALAATLVLVLVALRALSPAWRGVGLRRVLSVMLACIALAVAAEWAFGLAVKKAVGQPPLRLPHVMARLIDMGPGTDYLRRQCPEARFAACAWLANYPTRWDDFLFSTDPSKGAFALADADTKRRLAGEQLRFAAAVLRHDPVGVVGGVGADVVRQLFTFRVDIFGYRDQDLVKYLGRVPDAVYQQMERSRGARNTRYNEALSLASYAGVLAALAVGAWLWRRRRTGATPPAHAVMPVQDFQRFAALVIAGVIANAVVCATLASTLDRFQARVVWLLPFVAVAALLLAARRRAALAAATPGLAAPLGPVAQSASCADLAAGRAGEAKRLAPRA